MMVKVLPGARQIVIKPYPTKNAKFCRNCKFCIKGHYSPNIQWYETNVCLKKPKIKWEGCYYATTLTTRACNLFEES